MIDYIKLLCDGSVAVFKEQMYGTPPSRSLVLRGVTGLLLVHLKVKAPSSEGLWGCNKFIEGTHLAYHSFASYAVHHCYEGFLRQSNVDTTVADLEREVISRALPAGYKWLEKTANNDFA
jgi:hypothetical protein